jgi:cell division protein FtsX
MFLRILSNTRKHIIRSGWVGWASVFIMTMAFLVGSTFALLAYIANLNIRFIENRSNVLIFFEVGVDAEIIDSIRSKWEADPRIEDAIYVNEDDAYNFYIEYTSQVAPEQFEALRRFDTKKLPSSLELNLKTLDDLDSIEQDLEVDIEASNEKLKIVEIEVPPDSVAETTDATAATETVPTETTATETTEETPTTFVENEEPRYKYTDKPGEKPVVLKIDSESLNTQKEIFKTLRIAGVGILVFLFIFIGIFIFMTVEFRLYNQKEENGVMQLVGGSLMFIRSPYILEGGFYGMVGALVSSLILGSIFFAVFVAKVDPLVYEYIYKNLSNLPWDKVNEFGWMAIVSMLTIIGFVVGALSSFFSIRRYIR